MTELEAIILAAGLSRRMGCNKLLLPLGNGTVFGQFLTRFPFSLFSGVTVVFADNEVAEIARPFPVRLCRNRRPEAGKSHSIRLGLSAGNPEHGVLFSVADQPLLTPATIGRLVEIFHSNPQRIVVPVANGLPANPVIFPADLRPELLQLPEDEGGRSVICRNPERVLAVPFAFAQEFLDMDTEDAYQEIRQQWKKEY